MQIGITVFFAVTTVILLVLWLSLRHSVKEVTEAFKGKVTEDTNTLVTISSADARICELASELNSQLSILTKERRKYQNGDEELKQAMTNISHDIRTPLTAICSYLDLLDEVEKSKEVARYLEVIRERAKSLTDLTEELFHYSIVTSKEDTISIENVTVNEVLEESIVGFYAALKGRNIIPNIKITEQKIIRRGDKKALSRVFSNIINNALKYSAGDLNIELKANGGMVFSNTAPELNEVMVGRLFDRFYTVETARKSTGLGLTIARTLMEQMHGEISAEYREGMLYILVDLPRENERK